MVARPPSAPAAAKKKPVKVPPVPPHKRQQPVPGHSIYWCSRCLYRYQHPSVSSVWAWGRIREHIDAHLIQERVTDAQQNPGIGRETIFGPAQISTAAVAAHGGIQEQLAGQFQHGPKPPLSYAMVKSKTHQRLQVEEVEIKEAAPSLEPAPTIIVKFVLWFLVLCSWYSVNFIIICMLPLNRIILSDCLVVECNYLAITAFIFKHFWTSWQPRSCSFIPSSSCDCPTFANSHQSSWFHKRAATTSEGVQLHCYKPNCLLYSMRLLWLLDTVIPAMHLPAFNSYCC